MLLGLINPDLGNIKYLGDLSLAEFKSKIGVVFQNNVSDDLLTPKEILLLFAKIVLTSESQAEQRVDEIVEALKMTTFMNRQFKYLSGGEKRKTEIARALLGSPELLFLDEPTTGLDPKTRAEVWDLLNQIRTQNTMTIFLTTHYMEEVAEADQVVIIHQGQLIAQGSPAELKLNFSQDSLLLTPIDPVGLEKTLTNTGFDWVKVGDSYRVNSDSVSASINLLTSLRDNLKSFEVTRGDMDDVFLNAVGEQISEGT
jgi:multidrug/hemolysin transport system ATP-binding protein